MDFSGKTLVLLMGLPRSGKSTIAKRILKHKGWPVVNPDSFRLAVHGTPYYGPAEKTVWANVDVAIRALFLAGHTHILLDATNVKRHLREAWNRLGCNVLVYEVADARNKDLCVQRAAEGGRDDLVSVIEKMAEEYEPLEEDESKLSYIDLPSVEIDFVISPMGEQFQEKSDETPGKSS